MGKIISQRQREVLEHLRNFIETHGHSPTIWDVARHFGFSSPATVHKYLVALESAGYITRGKRNALVQLVKDEPAAPAAIDIPLYGKIAAGRPIVALQNDELFTIPPDLLGKRTTYALRVVGDSMIDDHICDGDTIIVESRDTAENGQTVVALVGEGEATVKRFYRENDRIRLQPANQSLQPFIYTENEVKVQGVVIGVVRRY
ncbi:MAG TPA: transcriptional repressor LexA [Blastocatellia bacterium]|nr:transcriptional repressor LexA [Blastocatellia bacterium]